MFFVESELSQKKVLDALSLVDRAQVEKDAQALDNALADNFIGATPTGEYFAKPAYIKHHCIPGFGLISLTHDDRRNTIIRFFGNTAVINRRVQVSYKIPNGTVL